MQNFVKLGVIASLGIGSTALAAEGVSHTFVEAGYGYSEVMAGAADGDGYALAASYELPSNFIVRASYQDFSYSNGADDLTDLSAGLGYKFALGSAFDVVGGASFERLESGGFDTDGFGLGVVATGRLTDQFELSAGLKYRDLADVPSYFETTLAGRYYVKPQFSVGLDVSKGELGFALTTFVAKLRYDFGQR